MRTEAQYSDRTGAEGRLAELHVRTGPLGVYLPTENWWPRVNASSGRYVERHLVGPGIHVMAAQRTISKQAALQGFGAELRRVWRGAMPTIVVTAHKVVLEDLVIDNQSGDTTAIGLQAMNVEDLVVRRCTFKNFIASIQVFGCTRFRVEDCVILNNGDGHGISILGDAAHLSSQGLVSGNYVTKSRLFGSYGIYGSDWMRWSLIHGNVVYDEGILYYNGGGLYQNKGTVDDNVCSSVTVL